MSLNTWPRNERPREKLLHYGAQSLSDAELLAIFVRSGQRGQTAVDVSRRILRRIGGLRRLVDATRNGEETGLSPARRALLEASVELNTRYLKANLARGDVLSSSEDTRRLLDVELRHRPYEAFLCLFLDPAHQLIRMEVLSRGVVNLAPVCTRQILEYCLQFGASSLIIAHNHPSGRQSPSAADRAFTTRLQKALDLVGIRLLDHFIVGEGPPLSFAEQGWLTCENEPRLV